MMTQTHIIGLIYSQVCRYSFTQAHKIVVANILW